MFNSLNSFIPESWIAKTDGRKYGNSKGSATSSILLKNTYNISSSVIL